MLVFLNLKKRHESYLFMNSYQGIFSLAFLRIGCVSDDFEESYEYEEVNTKDHSYRQDKGKFSYILIDHTFSEIEKYMS